MARAHRAASRLAVALALAATAPWAAAAGAADVPPAAAARCLRCHAGPAASPRLDGQYEGYLLKQLRNFRDGDRALPPALAAEHALAPAELRALAAHFAGLPRPGGQAGDDAQGRRLYLDGDVARNLPACVGCHGPWGQDSVSETTPLLHRQDRAYLEQQLRHWRARQRANSVDGMMNLATEPLADADIRAVAAYLAGRP